MGHFLNVVPGPFSSVSYILQGNAPIGNIRRSDFFDGHDDIYSVLKYMLNHSKKKRPISIDYVINELSRIMQKYKFVC